MSAVTGIAATLLGAGFGTGLWLIVDGVTRRPRPSPGGLGRFAAMMTGRGPVRLAGVIAAIAFVGWTTGWPVGGLLAGLAVWALPGMLIGGERARLLRLRTVEAIATWTESLVATMESAAGLEQAIITTASTSPPLIRGHVQALSAALREGVRLPAALRAFAADLADPVADPVVAALLLASRQGAARLSDPLRVLAAGARDEVSARRRVEKSRAKAATDARLIIITTVVMAVGLVAFSNDMTRPFSSAGGQVVLALVGVLFAVGIRWLHALSRQDEPVRVLDLDSRAVPR